MNDATAQNAEAVEALAPEIRRLEAGGKTYEIKRLETRQVWPILRAGLPILDGLVKLVKPADSPLGGEAQPASQPVEPSALASFVGPEIAQFLQIMAEHGERITEIVAIGIDEKVSTVGRFEPQETYLVLKGLIEVNRDFFTTRVAPLLGLQSGGETRNALSAAISQATAAMASPGDGPTPSSS